MPSGQPESPLDQYYGRVETLRAAHYAADLRKWWYLASLVALALGAAVGFYQVRRNALPAWSLAAIIPLAAYAGRGAGKSKGEDDRLYRLRRYYENGIARLHREWDSLPTGEEYGDSGHLYAADLDLFGRGSLYQALCSARTRAGMDTLARWMKEPASVDEARARGAAVRELWERAELREAIAAAGPTAVSDFRGETFRDWVSSEPAGFPAWAPVAAFLLASFVAIIPLWAWVTQSPQLLVKPYFLAALALEGAFAVWLLSEVRSTLEWLRIPSAELPVVLEVVRTLEQRRFSSPRLVELSGRLRCGRSSASRSLSALIRLVNLLEQRNNQMFTLASYLLLWSTQFTMAIDRWRRKHGSSLLAWIEAVGEFEALISIATYACEHPRDPFPEFAETGPAVEGRGIGHPLLDEEKCIRNDFRLGESARFLVISGSNMSGKSTFLRAVGLNAVLAQMGAPVRCHGLRLSTLGVAASILVHDSLADGRSHFLAELERLRQMIDQAGRAPLLFVIDEILIGTNSRDRRIAAEWVLRALASRGAVGLVSTHDLALTEIADAAGLPGRNFHFTDTGDPSGLEFDFILRPGVAQHSNALNIVRHLGIDAGEPSRP